MEGIKTEANSKVTEGNEKCNVMLFSFTTFAHKKKLMIINKWGNEERQGVGDVLTLLVI